MRYEGNWDLFVKLDWIEQDWTGFGLDWTGLGQNGSGWIGLN